MRRHNAKSKQHIFGIVVAVDRTLLGSHCRRMWTQIFVNHRITIRTAWSIEHWSSRRLLQPPKLVLSTNWRFKIHFCLFSWPHSIFHIITNQYHMRKPLPEYFHGKLFYFESVKTSQITNFAIFTPVTMYSGAVCMDILQLEVQVTSTGSKRIYSPWKNLDNILTSFYWPIATATVVENDIYLPVISGYRAYNFKIFIFLLFFHISGSHN